MAAPTGCGRSAGVCRFSRRMHPLALLSVQVLLAGAE